MDGRGISRRKSGAGNTLTEYGLMAGLILIVAIAGVGLLGQSTHSLFNHSNQQLKKDALESMVRMDFNANKQATTMALSGAGSGNTSISSAKLGTTEGQATFSLLNNQATTSSGVNATSTEGTWIAQSTQSLSYAQQVEVLAQSLDDEASQSWAASIAQSMYYLGGTEGSFASISDLVPVTQDGQIYNRSKAYGDLLTYQDYLSAKLSERPAASGSEAETITRIAALAQATVHLATDFQSTYTKAVEEGTLPTLSDPNTSFMMTNGLNQTGKRSTLSYADLVDYDTLRQNANTVLSSGAASHIKPVETTLHNATHVETVSP